MDRQANLINPNYTYLQKTLPGGIMLIELGFRDVYFCVNVYALECSRLPVGKTVNRQVRSSTTRIPADKQLHNIKFN